MKKILKTKNARKTLRKLETLKSVSKSGKIYSVVFTKKDGSERIMSCRQGVTKHLRGGTSTTAHIPHLLTTYSCNDKGYRNINICTISQIKGNGRVYSFK